jgi:hypothetical protein
MIAQIMFSLKHINMQLPCGQLFDVDYDVLKTISRVVDVDLVKLHLDMLQQTYDISQYPTLYTSSCITTVKLSRTPSTPNDAHLVYVGKLYCDAVYRCVGQSLLLRFDIGILDIDPQFSNEFYITKHK